jgi:hypothetical protein
LREWITPFGREVVPEVKNTIAGSSASRGGNDSTTSPARRVSSACHPGASIHSAGARETRGLDCSSTSATNAEPELVPASNATAPALHVAWIATTASTVFPMASSTESPGSTPHVCKAVAARPTASSSSAYVSVARRSTSATRSGNSATASATRSTGAAVQDPELR